MCVPFKRLAACAVLGFAAGAFAHAARSQPEGEVSDEHAAWTYVVIKLEYADAEEIALVLRQLLPPTVRVRVSGVTWTSATLWARAEAADAKARPAASRSRLREGSVTG